MCMTSAFFFSLCVSLIIFFLPLAVYVQAEVEEMKKNKMTLKSEMAVLRKEDKRLTGLQIAAEEVSELKKQLAIYKQDKAAQAVCISFNLEVASSPSLIIPLLHIHSQAWRCVVIGK